MAKTHLTLLEKLRTRIFHLLGLPDQRHIIDEADDPEFPRDGYYPAAPGLVLLTRFKLVGKVGVGSLATIWVARDLFEDGKFVILKIPCLQDSRPDTERRASEYLQQLVTKCNMPQAELFSSRIRLVENSFVLAGVRKADQHMILAYAPAGGDMWEVIKELEGGIPKAMLRTMVRDVLRALHFMHQVGGIVHGDLHPGNILAELADAQETCREFEKAEQERPCLSTKHHGQMVYESRTMDGAKLNGHALLADLGAAFRVDDEVRKPRIAMPAHYRGPECLFGFSFDEKLDIWSLGLSIWLMQFGTPLINYSCENRVESRLLHVCWMMSILGAPTREEFAWMKENGDVSFAFDGDGYFRDSLVTSFAPYENLEGAIENVRGWKAMNKEAEFIRFIRRMLTWCPADRASASELLSDPWLAGGIDESY